MKSHSRLQARCRLQIRDKTNGHGPMTHSPLVPLHSTKLLNKVNYEVLMMIILQFSSAHQLTISQRYSFWSCSYMNQNCDKNTLNAFVVANSTGSFSLTFPSNMYPCKLLYSHGQICKTRILFLSIFRCSHQVCHIALLSHNAFSFAQ